MDEYYGQDGKWHPNGEGQDCFDTYDGHDFVLEPEPVGNQWGWAAPPDLYCKRCKFIWRVEEA